MPKTIIICSPHRKVLTILTTTGVFVKTITKREDLIQNFKTTTIKDQNYIS